MSYIHVLDESTINQIAAGEVVERPSAIVKELIENAMDAGATAITAEIKEGGLTFIRITDNGAGIAKEDIPLAFLRHATSKIRTAEDLLSVTSLGFRGEALSSIASVAQVEMITKTPTALNGLRYLIEGGDEKSLEEIGCPSGTTIIVRNIFFNTPARRKFLKSAMTEAGYISDLMERLMVSHPNVSFKFIMNNQVKLQSSGNNSSKDILYQVYGRDITRELLPVDFTFEKVKVTGFIGKPVITRGNRNFENYFINGRYIKSSIITKAIEEAYKTFMMQHKYPFTSLYFEIDPSMIDVNVHPQKLEIRLNNSEEIYQLTYHLIKDTLSGKEMIPKVSLTKEGEQKEAAVPMPEPFEQKRRMQFLNQDITAKVNANPTTTAKENVSQASTTKENMNHSSTTGDYQQKPLQFTYGNADNKPTLNKVSEHKTGYSSVTSSKSETPKASLEALSILSGASSGNVTNALSSTLDLSINNKNAEINNSLLNNDNINTTVSNCINSSASSNIDTYGTKSTNNSALDNKTLTNSSNTNTPNQDDIINSTSNNVTNLSSNVSNPSSNVSNPALNVSTGANNEPASQIIIDKQLNLFADSTSSEDAHFISKKAFEEHRIIGQIFSTYWLVEYKTELYIIDQHAAHEKVLYEKIMTAAKAKTYVSQQLLPPIVLSLTLREQEVLHKREEVLNSLGYEIEHFGGNEYSIRAVPADLYGISEKELLLEFIDDLVDDTSGGAPSSNSILERVASMSCKAAVKANHSFSFEEASALIKELLTLDNPYHCPHGRPVIISMSQYELERKFKRIL